MGIFKQLGDPVCPDCLCEHHGAVYTPHPGVIYGDSPWMRYESIASNAVIDTVQIVTTERCCIIVNTAMIATGATLATYFEIERPLGTIRTSQEDRVLTESVSLLHHAAWEALPAGTYTYYLVNRAGTTRDIYAAWLKAIASDCEG